jgi:hypothetical protein
MKSLLSLAIVLISSGSVYAAISQEVRTEGALRLPLENRLQALEKQGPEGRLQLEKVAFDKSETLENRWRAVTSYGRLYKNHAREFLEKSLSSPEWFMRNAALVVVPYNQRPWAIQWARLLMHDPALVVRTAAVKTLRQLNATETSDLLWQKLYSSENYRAGQSLWIRRHILEALVQFASRGQEKKFISLLKDKDQALHPLAVRGLEKVTQKKFETTEQWQAWWQKRSTTL